MDLRERIQDPQEALRAALDDRQAQIWTALPASITSVHADGQHATFQPSIKSIIRNPDGTTTSVNLPVLPDVPLHFPTGGGATMTFPVKEGDEALLVFSSRPIDTWQQSGGQQGQIDARMHDLSDAFALVGFKSSPNAIANVSTDATEIRTNDGQTVISLKADEVAVKTSSSSSVVKPDSIVQTVDGMLVSITSSRVDLGGLGGQEVVTIAGPSSKVFAIL
jgi:hypothetical protein